MICTTYYPPGYLGGGPARSVEAIARILADDYAVSVITSANRGAAPKPYARMGEGRWHDAHGIRVWYHPGIPIVSDVELLSLLFHRPTLYYLNSVLSPRYTLLPLLVRQIFRRRSAVLLAPRGEFADSALASKTRKKRVYLWCMRRAGMFHAVRWHAATEQEAAQILSHIGSDAEVMVAGDVRLGIVEPTPRGLPKRRVVFFSRITNVKNLEGLLRALELCAADFELTIGGPIDDSDYWGRCQEIIGRSSRREHIRYVGPIEGEKVVEFLAGFDLFVLPTFGESYGHAILEALAAGTPVIIGPDTPWSVALVTGAGWLCDPTSPSSIAAAIDAYFALSQEDKVTASQSAASLARSVLDDQSQVELTRQMFEISTVSTSDSPAAAERKPHG